MLVAVEKKPLSPSIEEHEGQCCNFAVKCYSLEQMTGKEGIEEKYYPMELVTRDDKSLTCTELDKHYDMLVAGMFVAGGAGAAARLDISSSQPILINKRAPPPVGKSASSSGFSSFSTASPTAAVAEPTAKAVSFTERNPPDSGILSIAASKEAAQPIAADPLERNITPDISTTNVSLFQIS